MESSTTILVLSADINCAQTQLCTNSSHRRNCLSLLFVVLKLVRQNISQKFIFPSISQVYSYKNAAERSLLLNSLYPSFVVLGSSSTSGHTSLTLM